MFNRCIFIGHLTRDPELKALGSNNVCKFTIAMNQRSKDKTGATIEEVCFVDCTAWGKQAEFVNQFFHKGKEILVEGRLKLETWNKDGVERSKHVIVVEKVAFVGSKEDKPATTSSLDDLNLSDAMTIDDLL